jgi:protein SCO1/2
MRNVLSAAIAGLTLLAACSPSGETTPAGSGASVACTNRSSDKIGGPFRLTSSDGRTVTEQDFKGRKTFVFFGYTYCPDICPITMFNLGKALADIPADKRPATLFVSVDPERDTPEKLDQYIHSNGFPQDITGVSGSKEALEQLSTAFATTFGRGEENASAGGYLVSHSSILYLMDENWNLQTFFMKEESPADIAACVKALG